VMAVAAQRHAGHRDSQPAHLVLSVRKHHQGESIAFVPQMLCLPSHVAADLA